LILPDIARIIAKGMDFDLTVFDRELFADAEEAFGKIEAKIRTEQRDPENPVLIIEKKDSYAKLPFSKNIIRVGTNFLANLMNNLL